MVGTASLDHDRVRDVFVDVARHRRRIGKQLMAAIEAAAQQRHLEKVHLMSGVSAYEFYEKLGYKIVKRFDRDLKGIVIPEIQMEKALATV